MMETLIVEAKDQKELETVKAVLKALNVSFKKENTISQGLVDVIERGRADAKAGRVTVIKSNDDLWKLDNCKSRRRQKVFS